MKKKIGILIGPNEMKDKIRNQIWGHVSDQVVDQIMDKVRAHVRGQVDYKIFGDVYHVLVSILKELG